MPRKPTPSILEDAMNASGDEETQADQEHWTQRVQQ